MDDLKYSDTEYGNAKNMNKKVSGLVRKYIG